MEDRLIGYLFLTVSLVVGNIDELGLAPQGATIVGDLCSIKLPFVVKDHGARDAEVSNDVLPYEPSHFSSSDGGDSFGFDPSGEVVYYYKKIFALTCCLGKRPEYVHAPSSKQ